jgi:putative Holliday junction resolvase
MISNVLGLDIGEKRIGVARANMVAKIPTPLCTLENDDNFIDKLKSIANKEQVDLVVIGLPRNMSGEETKQSQYVRKFVNAKIKQLGFKVLFADETLSSVSAQERLLLSKKSKTGIDSIAASIILEDYLKTL